RSRCDVPGRVSSSPRTAATPAGRARRCGRRSDDHHRRASVRPSRRARRRRARRRCARRTRRKGHDGNERASIAGAGGLPRRGWLISVSLLLALGAASYALKPIGPVLAGGRELGPRVRRTLDLVAVPLLAALILVQTLGTDHRLVPDPPPPAVGGAR